jgi:hypothetical protein
MLVNILVLKKEIFEEEEVYEDFDLDGSIDLKRKLKTK